jgi:ubiquinone/menaquinone biosynthesis C-methylase UbiE/DNA-binding transcriptional ArsR family regulator
MMKTAENTENLVGWMESLADRTRLRLLRLLEHHELGVVELCDILQLPQSTVSRHLKILADQKWVHNRRDGATHWYRTILDELEPAARKLWLLAREQTADWATVHQDELRLRRRLRNREQDAQTFFAGAAGKWDKLRRELYGESFTNAAMLALLPRDYVIADLGCGTGQTTALLADHVKQVIGVDSSAAMLKAASKRIGEKENVKLFRGDLASTPLENESCDAALLLLVLTYVPTIATVLREANRITKAGGKIVIVDLLLHDRDDFRRQMGQQHSGFDLQQLKIDLTAAGFSDVNVSPLAPEPNAKGPALFLAGGTRNK